MLKVRLHEYITAQTMSPGNNQKTKQNWELMIKVLHFTY